MAAGLLSLRFVCLFVCLSSIFSETVTVVVELMKIENA